MKRARPNDYATTRDTERVVEWCNRRGVNVEFERGCESSYCVDEATIYVDSAKSKTKILHVLLHECGHVLVNGMDKREYKARFGRGYPFLRTGRGHGFGHDLDMFLEEVEAWERGFKLARRLALRVTLRDYSRTRDSFLKTYLPKLRRRAAS